MLDKSPNYLTFSRGNAEENQIQTFEEMLGVKLPNDYRQFLLNTNGGCPKHECVTYDTKYEYLQIKVNPISTESLSEYFEIDEIIGSFREMDVLKEHLHVILEKDTYKNIIDDDSVFMFARSAGAFPIYLMVFKGDKKDSIYLFDEENIYFVANNFTSLYQNAFSFDYFGYNAFTNLIEQNNLQEFGQLLDDKVAFEYLQVHPRALHEIIKRLFRIKVSEGQTRINSPIEYYNLLIQKKLVDDTKVKNWLDETDKYYKLIPF